MNRIIIISLMLLIFYGCSKDSFDRDKYYLCEIVGYDLNCESCLLHFLEDSLSIAEEYGTSEYPFYNTVNLPADFFTINQKIQVKVSKENGLKACKALFLDIEAINLFIEDYKLIE